MATTVNQKVANPSILGNSTTGTGSIVLSESPTINNPNLTGSVSANVNLRSGTLGTLLPLAGGISEIGYATDANALVRFNGAAGQAQIITGGATSNFTFTIANVNQYTNSGASYIDCRNLTTLNIYIDDALANEGTYIIESINIRFPLISFISFTVNLVSYGPLQTLVYGQSVSISPLYQPEEPFTPTYSPIDADRGSVPKFQVDITPGTVSFKFIGSGGIGSYYTRLAIPEVMEGQYFSSSTLNSSQIGYSFINSGSSTPQALTTAVVKNTGTITFPAGGVWMVSGVLNIVSTNTTVVAPIVSAGLLMDSATDNPSGTNITAVMTKGRLATNINSPAGTITRFTLPTAVIDCAINTVKYQNVYAEFNPGTLSAYVIFRATKLA